MVLKVDNLKIETKKEKKTIERFKDGEGKWAWRKIVEKPKPVVVKKKIIKRKFKK